MSEDTILIQSKRRLSHEEHVDDVIAAEMTFGVIAYVIIENNKRYVVSLSRCKRTSSIVKGQREVIAISKGVFNDV